MKPYYQDDYVALYHGDCREIVPTLGKFDLMLTDPPYGMNYRSNRRESKHEKIFGDNDLPIDEIKTFIDVTNRASYVFSRWDNLSEMPKPKSVIVWAKNNWTSGDLEHEHGRMWEAICFYPRTFHKFIKRIPDVIFCARCSSERHPTEKPEALLAELIKCNVGDTILDPFAGSGTTGRAAKDLHRKCVLIEKEERYCEIAAKRMAQEVFPLT